MVKRSLSDDAVFKLGCERRVRVNQVAGVKALRRARAQITPGALECWCAKHCIFQTMLDEAFQIM